ncbi:hypothetical protein I6N90_07585 [Paenibacillus sp. GSMTC-2017]|uniref:hypothetical protein n=1 Tax=Paenibacillus sp. GSMTC-2017 TaxID=2794350 RepID=UPI0018D6DB4B|nr:hypothetical protein [Paenibacillus sp. GSMTC-2017]MBH5317661.1 hypothetical protein [Paenibacillus sp. GSMTC-2017]
MGNEFDTVVVVSLLILEIIFLLFLVIASNKAKRKVGQIVFKFDSSDENAALILIFFSIMIAHMIYGMIFMELTITLMFIISFPVFFIFHNPAYLGEKGIKVSYHFIEREQIEHYKLIEYKYRTGIELFISNKKKPIKLDMRSSEKRDEMIEALEQYFNNKSSG